MVVVLPAGAQIPAPPPLRVVKPALSISQGITFGEDVSDLVASFTAESACAYPIITLNLESILPYHLKQQPTPRELGAVKFTLDCGIVEKHHCFINPGALPRGFMHEAQYHAETHKIPVLDFEKDSDDYASLYRNTLEFIGDSNVVFTSTKLIQYTQDSLNWLAQKAGTRRKIQVLSLESLSLELVSLITEYLGYNIRIEDELRPQILEHITHIGCKYHATNDIPVCAVSTSTRQAVATHSFLQPYFMDHLTRLDPALGDNRSRLLIDSRSGAVCSAIDSVGPPSASSPGDTAGWRASSPLSRNTPLDDSAGWRASSPRSRNTPLDDSAGWRASSPLSRNTLLDDSTEPEEECALDTSVTSDDSMSSSLFTLPAMFQNVSLSPESSPTRQTNTRADTDNSLSNNTSLRNSNPLGDRQTNTQTNTQTPQNNENARPPLSNATPVSHYRTSPRPCLGRGYFREALLRTTPRRPNKS